MSRWSARRAVWALPAALLGACTAPNPAYRPLAADGAALEPALPEEPDHTTRPPDGAALLMPDAGRSPLPLPDASFPAPDAGLAAPPDLAPDGPLPRVAGLVGYWSFEGGGGTMARDWSGNDNHGFLENLTPQAWVVGRTGTGSTALMFPPVPAGGLPPGVRIPWTQAIDDMRAFTLSAWFYRTVVPANVHDSVFSRQLDNTNFEIFNITCSTQDLIVYIPGMSPQVNFEARYANAAGLRTWVHAAATYDGATLRLYVGGIEKVVRNNFTNRLRSSPNKPIYIGANVNSTFTETFEGMIDDVTLFSEALPPDQISKLAGGSTPFQLQRPTQ